MLTSNKTLQIKSFIQKSRCQILGTENEYAGFSQSLWCISGIILKICINSFFKQQHTADHLQSPGQNPSSVSQQQVRLSNQTVNMFRHAVILLWTLRIFRLRSGSTALFLFDSFNTKESLDTFRKTARQILFSCFARSALMFWGSDYQPEQHCDQRDMLRMSETADC